jgi:hypothetical protein
MTFEMTDHVPGLTDEQVAALDDEALAGYDITRTPAEPNPHQQRQLVPEDLLDAIDERAEQDGQSREEIVRRALTTYLNTA